MIAYFDTSAIVPLLIEEPGSETAGAIWDSADHLVSVLLAHTEARAALAQAARIDRITRRQLERTKRELDGLLNQLDFVAVDDALVRRAGGLAESHALRAYDAIHLGAAQVIADDELVLVAGDRALLVAAEATGIATATIG